jgi:hypothetical protein
MDDMQSSGGETDAGTLELAHDLLASGLPLEGEEWESNWESVYQKLFTEDKIPDMLALAWKLVDPDWYEELVDYMGEEVPEWFDVCSLHALRGLIFTRQTQHLPDILCLMEEAFDDYDLSPEWNMLAESYGAEAVPYLAAFSKNEEVSIFARAESLYALAHSVSTLPPDHEARTRTVTFLRDVLQEAFNAATSKQSKHRRPLDDAQMLYNTYAANALWSLDGESSQAWIDQCQEVDLLDDGMLYEPLHGYGENREFDFDGDDDEEEDDEEEDDEEEDDEEQADKNVAVGSFAPWIERYLQERLGGHLTREEDQILMLFAEVCEQHFGESIETVNRNIVQEMLFDAYPAHVPMFPEDAPLMVQVLKEFWSFVAKEIPLSHADEIIAFLSDQKNLVRLKVELGDTSNWNMSKSIFMAGTSLGYDMNSVEGFQALAKTMSESFRSDSPHEMVEPPRARLPEFQEDRPTYNREERKKILEQKLSKNKKRR